MTTQVFSPEAVENNIRTCSEQIARGVSICDERFRVFLEADRVYDAAFAKAYMEHTGPAHERKYAAELETQTERAARDVADAAYRYADRRAKALENELRAWQSVGASVRAMYGVTGRGEG